MVDPGSSPTWTVTSLSRPRSRTSSATSARIRPASGGPSISVATRLDGKFYFRDVETERLREPDSDLEILFQPLGVARQHRAADERTLLGPPEGVLDERRQEAVGGVDQALLRLLGGALEEDALVRHPGPVVDPVVGSQAVAEVLEHGAARAAGDQAESRDDQPLVE